ncbi:DUF397 domain-containing protein [Streptomyces sp. NPDC017890]|uniref:DUF397 domain-containing protein n=1 Tax=Streptomyces sp. NPDC017890 TaxID=3365015 RepID=UPI0037BCA225
MPDLGSLEEPSTLTANASRCSGPEVDPNGVAWRRSGYSNQEGGDCVEVADGFTGVVPVRDSKVPGGPWSPSGTAPGPRS